MKRKYMMLICVLALMCVCTGCKSSVGNTMRDVEQRDYATILVVEPQDETEYRYDLGIAKERRKGEAGQTEDVKTFYCENLSDLLYDYEQSQGKSLSLSHLKVIFFTDTKPLEENYDCLMQLDGCVEIAKTCPVLVLSGKEAFLQYLKSAKEPVATKISDLIRARERQGKNIPWLKDYLKVYREGESIFQYELKLDEGEPVLTCDKIVA